MRLRDPRYFKQPSFMIIPMIDVMFFLLVFFMMTSLSMVDLRSSFPLLPRQSSSRRHSTSSPCAGTARSGWMMRPSIRKRCWRRPGNSSRKTAGSTSSSVPIRAWIMATSWPSLMTSSAWESSSSDWLQKVGQSREMGKEERTRRSRPVCFPPCGGLSGPGGRRLFYHCLQLHPPGARCHYSL
jgi:hypothetical protein